MVVTFSGDITPVVDEEEVPVIHEEGPGSDLGKSAHSGSSQPKILVTFPFYLYCLHLSSFQLTLLCLWLIYQDLSSRRARLGLIIESRAKADFDFPDVAVSSMTQLVRCAPSSESVNHAKTAARNFLELGLHQLGEAQRIAMLSAVAVLRTSPEFSTPDHVLLDEVHQVFSQYDAAQVVSSDSLARLNSFRTRREKMEDLQNKEAAMCTQISTIMTEYDAEEVEVRRLEEAIVQHKARMTTLLEKAESLEVQMVANQEAAEAISQELIGSTADYHSCTRKLQEAESLQSSCLVKWEELRRLFQ